MDAYRDYVLRRREREPGPRPRRSTPGTLPAPRAGGTTRARSPPRRRVWPRAALALAAWLALYYPLFLVAEPLPLLLGVAACLAWGLARLLRQPPPRMGKVRAQVRDTDGRWWTKQDGHWWGHVEATDTWERGARYDLPAGYGRQDDLVWNVQASDANGVLGWIGGDGVYGVVSAERHTVGDPIWACNNRVSLHLRRR